MTPPVTTEEFSCYTDKKRVKDLKNFSNSLKWKTHVESVEETIIAVNKTLSDEESIKVFEQPVGKKFTALGMLFEEFCRLEAKMKGLQKAKNGMLKPKVVKEHASSYQQSQRNNFERWTSSHWQINWLSVTIHELQNKANCVPYCRLEDKKYQQKEVLEQLSEQIETLIEKRDRWSKIRHLVQRYNQGLDALDKMTDQKANCLIPTARESLRKRHRETQMQGLRAVNEWMRWLQETKEEETLTRILLETDALE